MADSLIPRLIPAPPLETPLTVANANGGGLHSTKLENQSILCVPNISQSNYIALYLIYEMIFGPL